MSEIRYYLVLMTILVLGSIAECRSTRAKKNNPKPELLKACQDYSLVHRSAIGVKCVYYVSFGKQQAGDKLIEFADYCAPRGSNTPILTIGFPGEGTENKSTISRIILQYPTGSSDIWNEKLSIIEGGIGRKSFKVRIERDDPELTECYRLEIYGM